jgi:hypothetical protein
MAIAPKTKVDFEDLAKLGKTSEVLAASNQLRETRRVETEQALKEYKFPAKYNPQMGLREGRVYELRMFFHVIPGHAAALREELKRFKISEQRNSLGAHIMTGIQSMSGTLFDNDTRYLHCAEFDTEWDPYIDDSVPTPKQQILYARWFQHLEETKQFNENNIPTSNDIKVAFNMNRITADVYIRTFGHTTVEVYNMMDLKKAFDKVLDHPDAAKALEHPALKPLLDLASA